MNKPERKLAEWFQTAEAAVTRKKMKLSRKPRSGAELEELNVSDCRESPLRSANVELVNDLNREQAETKEVSAEHQALLRKA